MTRDPMARGLMLGALVAGGATITTKFIRDTFGVSPATAKRDMLAIESVLRANAEVAEGRQVRLCARPPAPSEAYACSVIRGKR